MGSKRLFRLPLFRRRVARAEMHEELAFHIDSRIAHLVARGMTPEAARHEALRRFGNNLADAEHRLEQSAELKERRLDVRDRWNDFVDDVRYAFRGLARNPGFTIVAVLTLAIGIGANTSIYSAVDALLLRSLPFREPSQLMDIVQRREDDVGQSQMPGRWAYARYAFFRDAQRSYAAITAHKAIQTTITGTDPERINAEEVSGTYLRTLGIGVARGTDFPVELDAVQGGAPRTVIISDALWERRFNADPEIVGKALQLNNEAWTIVGVMAPDFRGLSGQAEAWLNITARPADILAEPWSMEFAAIGRLREGVTRDQAVSEATAIGRRIHDAFPDAPGTLTTERAPARWTATARPLDSIRVASGLRQSLLVLFGAVALVLLIACVNLANLLVARALARKQEIAVRLAIGAGRGRLVRLLVTESVVLAMLGGVASLGVALLGTRVLSAINPQETLQVQGLSGGIGAVGFEGIRLDASALIFTFAVTSVVGLLFGLMPALRATRRDLARDLKDGSSAAGFSGHVGVSRRTLVVAEVALALVLLAGSGLMIRSLGNLLAVNPGFDATNVLTLRLNIPVGVVAPDSMPGFYEQLQREIAAVPGVNAVGLADCPPLNNGCNGTIMTFADRPQTSTGNAMVGVHWVSPSWFDLMRVPVTRGRTFTEDDRIGTSKVVIINEAAARRYFPGEDPIGKRVAVFQGGFNTGAEVIGIVGDVRYGTIDATAQPDAFISYGQSRVSRMMVFVRTNGDPARHATAVREVVRRFAPRLPIYDIRSMESRVATASAQARFSAVLLSLFAIVALTLAVIGIYGVMSFGVAQRSREIGIRVALGADRHRVLGLVLREGAVLAGVGAAIGLVAAVAATRVLRTMLFEVSATDVPTFAAMILLVGVAVLAASWVPARRAARTDPMTVLRKG